MIDLLVVGGGPAGLVTALHGARAGLDVVVVERRRGPIDKACGEGLMPHTLRQLERLGIDPP
ncbi:FAD-dependent oxidoreductase, partial [Mycolicibacterium pulveris]